MLNKWLKSMLLSKLRPLKRKNCLLLSKSSKPSKASSKNFQLRKIVKRLNMISKPSLLLRPMSRELRLKKNLSILITRSLKKRRIKRLKRTKFTSLSSRLRLKASNCFLNLLLLRRKPMNLRLSRNLTSLSRKRWKRTKSLLQRWISRKNKKTRLSLKTRLDLLGRRKLFKMVNSSWNHKLRLQLKPKRAEKHKMPPRTKHLQQNKKLRKSLKKLRLNYKLQLKKILRSELRNLTNLPLPLKKLHKEKKIWRKSLSNS